VRVPLLILSPGQTDRRDIYEPTSNIDVMPTLLNLAGQPVPDFCEGRFYWDGWTTGERNVFMVEAKKNSSFQPISKATIALVLEITRLSATWDTGLRGLRILRPEE